MTCINLVSATVLPCDRWDQKHEVFQLYRKKVVVYRYFATAGHEISNF
jgi:hypothetical protein